MSSLYAFLVSFVIGIPLSIYRAWTITLLWAWFIVPNFHVPPLTKLIAYGLTWLAWLVHGQYVPNDPKKSPWVMALELAMHSLCATTLGLFCGWFAAHLL